MSEAPPAPNSGGARAEEARAEEGPSSPAPPELGAGGAKRLALLALIVYIAFNLLLPLVRVPMPGVPLWERAVLVLGSTAVFMLLQLWLGQALVGLKPRVLTCVLVTAAAAGLWWWLNNVVFPHEKSPGLVSHWPIGVQKMLGYSASLLVGLSLTFALTFGGALLSRIIRTSNILMPVALIFIVVDYLGVMTQKGFTHNMLNSHPHVVQNVSVPVPAIGGLQPIAFVGPGDILFVAFSLAVVLRLGMNERGTFWLMYALLTSTMLGVLIFGIPLPALVPLGVAVLLANWQFFRLKREEVFAMFYAGGLILLLVAGFYAYTHAHFFQKGH